MCLSTYYITVRAGVVLLSSAGPLGVAETSTVGAATSSLPHRGPPPAGEQRLSTPATTPFPHLAAPRCAREEPYAHASAAASILRVFARGSRLGLPKRGPVRSPAHEGMRALERGPEHSATGPERLSPADPACLEPQYGKDSADG